MHPDRSMSVDGSLGPTLQPDAIELLLVAYAHVHGAWVIRVVSRGILGATEGQRPADLYVHYAEGAPAGHYDLSLDATAAPLDGHRIEWLGLRAHPGDPYDPRVCWSVDTSPGRRLFIRFLRQQIWHGQSLLYGELLTIPGTTEEQRIGGLEQPHTSEDRAAAWRALTLLGEHARQRAGQKPLEEKPQHPWRATAKRAEELQREHPAWGNRKLARELGMLGREETLRLWRKKLAENG
jgi:hypothetical protein